MQCGQIAASRAASNLYVGVPIEKATGIKASEKERRFVEKLRWLPWVAPL